MSLTLAEAAGELKVSARTLKREIADGKLHATGRGRHLRIDEQAFRNYKALCAFQAMPKEQKAQFILEWKLGPNPTHDALIELESVKANKCQFPYSGPAVYFLFQGDEIVYIGQTVNLLARVGSHFGIKEFDHYSYLVCRKEELLELERRAILKYRPKFNRA